MNIVKKLQITLATAALALPGAVLAHPGHEHQAGILERLQHAIIGWDQMVLLLAAGAVAGLLLLASKK